MAPGFAVGGHVLRRCPETGNSAPLSSAHVEASSFIRAILSSPALRSTRVLGPRGSNKRTAVVWRHAPLETDSGCGGRLDGWPVVRWRRRTRRQRRRRGKRRSGRNNPSARRWRRRRGRHDPVRGRGRNDVVRGWWAAAMCGADLRHARGLLPEHGQVLRAHRRPRELRSAEVAAESAGRSRVRGELAVRAGRVLPSRKPIPVFGAGVLRVEDQLPLVVRDDDVWLQRRELPGRPDSMR